MDLRFARLLTGKQQENEAFDAFSELSDDSSSPQKVLDKLGDLKNDYLSPEFFLGFLIQFIDSKPLSELASSIVKDIRTFSTTAMGKEILRHTYPKTAKLLVSALLTDDSNKRSLLTFRVIRRLVGALYLVQSPTRKVGFLKPKELFVSRIERPVLNEEIFPTSFDFSRPGFREGDFPINGLFSTNDLELSNQELFYILTRQTSSGTPMNFEDQFKRHLAWRLKGTQFETELKLFESTKNTFFKTPKGVPKGWPGWSPLGGVLLPLENYLDAFYKLRLIIPKEFRKMQDIQPIAQSVFHQQRVLWVLRHLAFFQANHTYLSFLPYLEQIKKELEAAKSSQSNKIPQNATLETFIPPSVKKILNQEISNYDSQGRFFTNFNGKIQKEQNQLERLASIPPGVLARIIVSSNQKDKLKAFEDPIFVQQLARDISNNVRNYLAREFNYTASPASSSNSQLPNLVSINPTLTAFLNSAVDTGLEELATGMVQTSTLDVAQTLDIQRSLAKAVYSDDFLWAFGGPVGRVEPLRVVSGSFAACPIQEVPDNNSGYVVSCLANRLSTQTYFLDDQAYESQRDGALYVITPKYSWNFVYPSGFYQASVELLTVADYLAEMPPLDGIESEASTLQQFAGQRVSMTSGGTLQGVNTVPLDAERYPVFDLLHSGYVGYMPSFGRCWSWLKHTMLRRGPEVNQNDDLFSLAVRSAVDQGPSWTWFMAGGSVDSLKKVQKMTSKAQLLLETQQGFMELNFSTLAGLPETLNDSVHPASLLMFYVSGKIDLVFEQVDDIYNDVTAPLMAFLVKQDFAQLVIEDLDVPLFTDNLLFETLKSLTKEMVQHLEHAELIEMASKTPLGRFVIQAAKGVVTQGEILMKNNDISENIEKSRVFYDNLTKELSELESRNNVSESYQGRIRGKMYLADKRAKIADASRAERLREIAFLIPKVGKAIKAIDAASETVKPLVFNRGFTLPIYAIAPKRDGFEIGAVSDGFVQKGDRLFGLTDSIFAGVYVQKEPNLFAREVEEAVLMAREKRSDTNKPKFNALELKNLKTQLRTFTENIFSLDALLTMLEKPNLAVPAGSRMIGSTMSNDALEELVTVVQRLVGDDLLEDVQLQGDEPLYRLYPQQPFDFSVATIFSLAKSLLDDLMLAFTTRITNRTPLLDGLTPLEKASIGPLQTNPLYYYELYQLPVSPLVRYWVTAKPPRSTSETWKTINLVVHSFSSNMISQKIYNGKLYLEKPDGLPENQKDSYIRWAQALAYLYDRYSFVELQGQGFNFQQFLQNLTDVSARTKAVGIDTNFRSLRNTLERFLEKTQLLFITFKNDFNIDTTEDPTLSDIEQWITTNVDTVRDLSEILGEQNYLRFAASFGDSSFVFSNTGNAVSTANILLFIEMVQTVQAIRTVQTTTFDGSEALGQFALLFRQYFDQFDFDAFTFNGFYSTDNYDNFKLLLGNLPQELQDLDDFITNLNIPPVPQSNQTTSTTSTTQQTMATQTLEQAFNKELPSNVGNDTTTQTARFGLWSPQVRLMATIAGNNSFESRYILWPWIINSTQRFYDRRANVKDNLGLADTYDERTGWTRNAFITIENEIAATFAALLYEELEQAFALIEQTSIDVANFVDSLMGKITGTFSLEDKTYTQRGKNKLSAKEHGKYLARVYTTAPQLILANAEILRANNYNPERISDALQQARKNKNYTNNFIETVDSIDWSKLAANRQKRRFTDIGEKYRYTLELADNSLRDQYSVQVYRTVQSCYNAAHIQTIFDEFSEQIGMQYGETDRHVKIVPDPNTKSKKGTLTIRNPLLLVAGMLRPTEPFFVRIEHNTFGVWMNGQEPHIVSRIKKMVERVDETTLSQPGPDHKKRGGVTPFLTSVSNKDTVSRRPSDQWYDRVSALFEGKDTEMLDFSNYSENQTIQEEYAILDRTEFANLMQTLSDLPQNERIVVDLESKIASVYTKMAENIFTTQILSLSQDEESLPFPSALEPDQYAAEEPDKTRNNVPPQELPTSTIRSMAEESTRDIYADMGTGPDYDDNDFDRIPESEDSALAGSSSQKICSLSDYNSAEFEAAFEQTTSQTVPLVPYAIQPQTTSSTTAVDSIQSFKRKPQPDYEASPSPKRRKNLEGEFPELQGPLLVDEDFVPPEYQLTPLPLDQDYQMTAFDTEIFSGLDDISFNQDDALILTDTQNPPFIAQPPFSADSTYNELEESGLIPRDMPNPRAPFFDDQDSNPFSI